MHRFPYAATAASIRDDQLRQRFVNTVFKRHKAHPERILQGLLRTSSGPNASAVNG